MRAEMNHLSAAELISFLDHEMSLEELAQVRLHLEECARCRTALGEMRETLAALAIGDSPVELPVSDENAARALLRTRLAEAGDSRAMTVRERIHALMDGRLFPEYFYAIVAASGLAMIFFFAPDLHRSVAEMSESLPNRALTPGMTRPVDVEAMCSAGDEDLDPEVPYSTQKAVFGEYGISIDHSAKDFQIDYLISPQLGGTDDVRNLWPQSYKDTKWNARAKDDLERHLYQLVCEKKINLADAQREIATNWIAAYQKYFRTSKPA